MTFAVAEKGKRTMTKYVDVDALLERLPNDLPYKASVKRVLMQAEGVEVRHSRWENISGFDVCNVCGTSPACCEPKPNNPKGYPPYCHQCGAKMDGNNVPTK